MLACSYMSALVIHKIAAQSLRFKIADKIAEAIATHLSQNRRKIAEEHRRGLAIAALESQRFNIAGKFARKIAEKSQEAHASGSQRAQQNRNGITAASQQDHE